MNKPAVGEQDVKIEMKFCGVCHSDVHFALNELAAGAGNGKLLSDKFKFKERQSLLFRNLN